MSMAKTILAGEVAALIIVARTGDGKAKKHANVMTLSAKLAVTPSAYTSTIRCPLGALAMLSVKTPTTRKPTV